MPPTPKSLLQKARKEGFAIGAFNASNIETIKAIVAAAEKLSSPVIIESSPGETDFVEPENLVDLVENYRRETGLPILINLDHAKSLKAAKRGIEAGYEMIHFDGSDLPFEENVAETKAIVSSAHRKKLLVEAEVGKIGGESAPHLQEDVKRVQAEAAYTEPGEAADFVRQTGVDIFAAFFGNVHGVYRQPPELDFELLIKIRSAVPAFLSLHGGSGIRGEDVKRAIKAGEIVKINVNTELRMAYRRTLEAQLAHSPEVAIYKLMPPVVEAVQTVVEAKIRLFGSEGRA